MFNCNFLVYLKLGVDEAFFSILKKGRTVFFFFGKTSGAGHFSDPWFYPKSMTHVLFEHISAFTCITLL
jgi:hypothetical protein